MESFTTWILEELRKRAWSNSELARRAGLSDGGLSKILNGNRTPTTPTLRKLAKGLNVPEAEVFRRAGALSPHPEEELTLREILDFLSEFSDDELESLKEYVEYRYQRQKERGQLKPRHTGSAG